MRRVGVTATLLTLAVLCPGTAASASLPAKAAGALRTPTRPGVRELMSLRTSRYALIQATPGARVPGGRLVSRRLGGLNVRPSRAIDQANRIPPATAKRAAAMKNGGIVRTATEIPRYVEPHTR